MALLATLRPYQDEAVDMTLARKSSLIAYEMGLGKTICALAIAEELLGQREGHMNAIVVPANLKWQWAQQIAQHTDVDTETKTISSNGEKIDITVPTSRFCVVIDGDAEKREGLLQFARKHRPDYVILGYENVVNDWSLVRRLKPGLICLDEATAIKTFTAMRTKKIKRWTAEYRIALTGSPIENGKPEEIFSIMQWVDDKVLGRFDLFDKSFITRNRYGGVERYKNMPVLHAKLSPVMSRKRRTDPEVAPYLPEVEETTEWVDIDRPTRAAYAAIGKDLLEALDKAAQNGKGDFDLFAHYHGGDDVANGSREQGEVMARMQALEMLLIHPDLIKKSAKDYAKAQEAKSAGSTKKVWPGSKYCWQVAESGILDGIKSSPKMDALVDMVLDITPDPKSKIIVFSYYRRAGSIISKRLAEVGVQSVAYHGEMSAAEKVAAVAKFRDDPDTRVLISSHAGAFGTDLHMANYLINFDLAWSAGTQDQINARHARVASKFKNIFIVNLLCTNTLEARKPKVLAYKRRTAAAIVDGKGADGFGRVENNVGTLTEYLSDTLGK